MVLRYGKGALLYLVMLAYVFISMLSYVQHVMTKAFLRHLLNPFTTIRLQDLLKIVRKS